MQADLTPDIPNETQAPVYLKKRKALKIAYNAASILGLLLAVAVCIYFYRMGIFTKPDAMQQYMAKQGAWAPLVFIIIQIVQVVIPIIPGGVSLAAGVVIFGPWFGFAYNYIGICIGSIINFLLSRHFGRPFVEAVISERLFKKYIGWLDKGKRFDTLFAWAIFLPVAPDDFLCMLAGISKMSFKKYVLIILLCKPLSIFLYSIGLTSLLQYIAKMLGG